MNWYPAFSPHLSSTRRQASASGWICGWVGGCVGGWGGVGGGASEGVHAVGVGVDLWVGAWVGGGASEGVCVQSVLGCTCAREGGGWRPPPPPGTPPSPPPPPHTHTPAATWPPAPPCARHPHPCSEPQSASRPRTGRLYGWGVGGRGAWWFRCQQARIQSAPLHPHAQQRTLTRPPPRAPGSLWAGGGAWPSPAAAAAGVTSSIITSPSALSDSKKSLAPFALPSCVH